VDFRLSEDQLALRDGIRAFCDGRASLDALRELERAGCFDRGLWRELAEMGVFALRLPEADGGVGLGMADAVLVFAELGRRLVPGPLAWSHLAAGLVPGAESGACVVGGVERARDGEPVLVEHLESLDALLVLRGEGVFRVDPRGLDARPLAAPLDPLTPLHHVAGLPEGSRIAGPEVAARLWREGAALTAAQQLGIAEATRELAVDYAGRRRQFGKPIGAFQSIKHLLADSFVRQEVARASVYAAGAILDHPEAGDPDRAVSGAAITAGEAALKNARTCIQVYGGMGFTWEMPCHYYLKRAWVLEHAFGTADEHADRIADGLGPDGDRPPARARPRAGPPDVRPPNRAL
jgi:alkylation response protein AidB-like acyl-CoA dehydrogenase